MGSRPCIYARITIRNEENIFKIPSEILIFILYPVLYNSLDSANCLSILLKIIYLFSKSSIRAFLLSNFIEKRG